MNAFLRGAGGKPLLRLVNIRPIAALQVAGGASQLTKIPETL
jgi:hypothetical protein